MFSDRQIFAEVFWCGRIAGKISNKKNDVSAPAIIKIYERILKGQRYICNIYTLPYIQKKYKQKSTRKHRSEVERCLKKRLAREINEIEIFRNIQQISLRRCHTFRNHLQNFGEFVSSFYKIQLKQIY